MQLITSAEHFNAHVAGLLEKAKANLCRDHDLEAVAIFDGPKFAVEAHVQPLPAQLVNPVIKAILQARQGVELVVYIGLAVYVSRAKWVQLPKRRLQDHPDAVLMIRAEASHVDFGSLNLHAEYSECANMFTFKPIYRADAPSYTEGLTVKDLWPKRSLNS